MWNDAWPHLTLQNLSRALDAVVELVKAPASDQSDDVTRALSRFLVVRACGYLEVVAEECCASYAKSRSSPRVAQYARSWLGHGRNPSPGSLVELVRRFDLAWSEELASYLAENDEFLKREVASLVDKRNKIAHGASEGITSRKALELTEAAQLVATWFIKRFDPR